MIWAIAVLWIVGILLVGFGYYVDAHGKSTDESMAAIIPWLLAILLFAIAAVMSVGLGLSELVRWMIG